MPEGKHELTFPAPVEHYIFNCEVVVFGGQDGGKRVCCEISREALDDHFGATGKTNLKCFEPTGRSLKKCAWQIPFGAHGTGWFRSHPHRRTVTSDLPFPLIGLRRTSSARSAVACRGRRLAAP